MKSSDFTERTQKISNKRQVIIPGAHFEPAGGKLCLMFRKGIVYCPSGHVLMRVDEEGLFLPRSPSTLGESSLDPPRVRCRSCEPIYEMKTGEKVAVFYLLPDKVMSLVGRKGVPIAQP